MDDIVNSVPSGCLPRLLPYAFCLLLELFSPGSIVALRQSKLLFVLV